MQATLHQLSKFNILFKQNFHTLQPFTQDYDLPPHTIYIVCVILYMSGGIFSLKSSDIRQILEKLFHAIFFLLSDFLPEII